MSNVLPQHTPRRVGDWRINLLLFGLTVVSVFTVGRDWMLSSGLVEGDAAHWWSGWPFALPLLLILLFHEFGHWIAAWMHRVPASLPYFLPMPMVVFGTFGAVITMPERIRSRNALLDIGAAGPLAGLVVALPALVIGLSLSEVDVAPNYGELAPGVSVIQEGQSLLYWALKRLTLGPIPEGYDVYLHPTALAAWGGLFITMINLLPYGQLDGGHIAYALLGDKHHRIARWLRSGLLLLFVYNLVKFSLPVWQGRTSMSYFEAGMMSLFWLLWYVITGFMGRLSGGAEHPPCEPGALSPGRIK